MGLTDLFWNSGKLGGVAGMTGLGSFGLSMAPMLLGGMFNRQDPLRAMQKQAQNYLNPNYINGLSAQMYRDFTGGAGFASAQRAAVGGAGAMQRALRGSSLSSISGIGHLRSALGQSLVGNKMAGLYASADLAARQQAQQLAQMQAQAVYQGGVPQNYTANLGAAGLNALLARYLSQPQQTMTLRDLQRLWGGAA